MKNYNPILKYILISNILLSGFPLLAQFFEPQVLYHGHGLISDAEVMDINGDGMEDIVVTRDRLQPNGVPAISLYVYEAYLDNNEIAYKSTITELADQSQLFQLDFDLDGDIDFITQKAPNIYSVSHAILENQDGNFSNFTELPDLLTDPMTYIHRMHDIDHDGVDEIIYTNQGLWSASIFSKDNIVIQEILPDLFRINILDVINFNNDGFEDFVIHDTENDELLVLVSQNNSNYLSIVA